MKSRSVFAVVLFLFAVGYTAGDTVTLKNGRILKGVVLKETENEIILRLKVTTTTIKKNEIDSIQKSESDQPQKETGERLPPWDRCIEFAAKQDWMTDLQAIPATVIDKGILKYVPYKSFRAGLFEINIYGDPDHPAGIEIGIRGELLSNVSAKKKCLAFVSGLMRSAGDKQVLTSLSLSKDQRELDGMTLKLRRKRMKTRTGGGGSRYMTSEAWMEHGHRTRN
jgi:hypothetical protein